MQPLISVDHESRHNSYREEVESVPSEDTPLLRERFPPPGPSDQRDLLTSAVVTILLIVLASGVIIGIYLLIQQSDAENVLPPVEGALQLVSRRQWLPGNGSHLLAAAPFTARHVLAVQTDSVQCWNLESCSELLRRLQEHKEGSVLPYNFVISSSGQTFEVLGWLRPSPAFTDCPHSLVLGFIGNFTETSPSEHQIKAAKVFFDESVSHKYLAPSFDIIGKDTRYSPKQLYQRLMTLKQWNQKDSNA